MKGTNPSLLPSAGKQCLLIPNSPDGLVKSLKLLCSFYSHSLYLLGSYSFFPLPLLPSPPSYSFFLLPSSPLFSSSLRFVGSFPTFRTSKFLQLYYLVNLKGCMDLCLYLSSSPSYSTLSFSILSSFPTYFPSPFIHLLMSLFKYLSPV